MVRNSIPKLNCIKIKLRSQKLLPENYSRTSRYLCVTSFCAALIFVINIVQSDLYYPRFLRPKFNTPNFLEIQSALYYPRFLRPKFSKPKHRGVQPHFCPWKNVCFPIFSHGEKSIWKEREMNTFPFLSIYFFSHLGKKWENTHFSMGKNGVRPPPPPKYRE